MAGSSVQNQLILKNFLDKNREKNIQANDSCKNYTRSMAKSDQIEA